MLKLIGTIDSVVGYSCYKGYLICSFENPDETGVIRKINFKSGETILEKMTDAVQLSFFHSDNILLAKDISNNLLLLGDNLNVESIPEPVKMGDNYSIKSHVSVYKGSIKSREFGVYSILDRDLLWMDSDKKSLIVVGDEMFGQTNFVIYRVDQATGAILWKQDLTQQFPELTEIKGKVTILGLFGTLVVMGLDKIDKLFALELETGVIKWQKKSFVALDKLDDEKGVIHSISSGYCKLDAATGEEKDTFIDRGYFEEVGIFSQRNNYVLHNNHIITTDHEKGIIGAFNTVSHKFDWVNHQEGVTFPAPKPMLFCDGHLFVQDNKGTLYIFEKS